MIGRRLIEEREVVKGSRKKKVYQATDKGNRFLGIYCDGLILLHGEAFLQGDVNLAGAYLLEYCRKNKVTLRSKVSKSSEALESDKTLGAAS
jgi:DNA-binding PadR family transcriptional regulator